MMNLEDIKLEYLQDELSREELDSDPFEQMHKWMDQILKSEITYPNAAFLATVTPDNSPDLRTILVKEYSKNGITFYTDYKSQKGQQLANNPSVSLLFFWKEFDRQIRIKGVVEKLSRSESEKYFSSRPHESKISASIGHQSQIISDENFKKSVTDLKEKYKNSKVPCPESWGGYVIRANEFEFWQGRPNRLHDRFVYKKDQNSWIINRLTP